MPSKLIFSRLAALDKNRRTHASPSLQRAPQSPTRRSAGGKIQVAQQRASDRLNGSGVRCYLPLVIGLLPWLVSGPAVRGSSPLTLQGGNTPIKVAVEQATAYWRQVGILKPGSGPACPQANGWEVRDLGTLIAGLGPAIPDTLRIQLERFCFYQSPTAITSQNLQDLQATVGGAMSLLAPDRLAVYPASELRDGIFPELTQSFDFQAGRIPLLPEPAHPIPRLALLDTAPSQTPCSVTDNSSHGYSLCKMAETLLCDDPTSCVGQIVPRLTLAYIAFDPLDPTPIPGTLDVLNGGHVGTIVDLGLSLLRELAAWNGSMPLVIPLALGWHGSHEEPKFSDQRPAGEQVVGGLEKSVDAMPPDVQLVFRALEAAACRGALVLAAAGNRPDELQKSGLLLPAAWEKHPVPAECGGASRPLIYSVGGVDAAGRSLGNALQGSQPARSAYGDHAVVLDTATGDPTDTLTGTSVSTYVVGAAAAAVWHYDPLLRAEQVMQHLEATGALLPDVPNPAICQGSGPCPAKAVKISVCEAVQPFCISLGVCPTDPCPGPAALSVPSLAGDTANLIATNSISAPGLQAVPWIFPQPGSNPCRSCLMGPDAPPPMSTNPVRETPNDDPPDPDGAKRQDFSSATGTRRILIEIESDYDGFLYTPRLDFCGSLFEIQLTGPCPSTAVDPNPPVPGLPPVAADCQLSFTVTPPSSCNATPSLIFDRFLPDNLIGTTLTSLLEVP